MKSHRNWPPKTICCKAPFKQSYSTLRCSKCFAPQPGLPAPWPKKDKSSKKINKIDTYAQRIQRLCTKAALATTEAQRDKIVESIMNFTEKIEEQYSSPWH